MVSVENFLYEVNEDIWIDMSCLVLSDPLRKINLQSFSQPTNIAAGLIERLKEGTPDNYPKQWSGFAVTIGNYIFNRESYCRITHVCLSVPEQNHSKSIILPYHHLHHPHHYKIFTFDFVTFELFNFLNIKKTNKYSFRPSNGRGTECS